MNIGVKRKAVARAIIFEPIYQADAEAVPLSLRTPSLPFVEVCNVKSFFSYFNRFFDLKTPKKAFVKLFYRKCFI